MWTGMTEAQIVHHLASGAPMPALPPDAIRPRVLDAICARALAMNPGERYETAAQLETDLQHVMAGAADSHARTLGRVISHAFGAARAEREALIKRALEGTGETWSPAEWAAASRAMKDSPWSRQLDRPRDVTWAREIDAFIAAADGLLDVTLVDPEILEVLEALPPDPPPPPPPPPPPRPRLEAVPRRSRVGGALAGLALTAAVSGLIAVELGRPSPSTSTAAAQAGTPTPREEASRDEAPTELVAPRSPQMLELARRLAAINPPAETSAAGRRHGRLRARVPAGEARTEAPPLDEPNVGRLEPLERRRPASLREIDESDPFK
jgi:hypothetical protein